MAGRAGVKVELDVHSIGWAGKFPPPQPETLRRTDRCYATVIGASRNNALHLLMRNWRSVG